MQGALLDMQGGPVRHAHVGTALSAELGGLLGVTGITVYYIGTILGVEFRGNTVGRAVFTSVCIGDSGIVMYQSRTQPQLLCSHFVNWMNKVLCCLTSQLT